MRKAIWILWPSFIVAGAAAAAFFTFFDPSELDPAGRLAGVGRMAVYSGAFFAFWVLAAASSAVTCFLQRKREEINSCPLMPLARPEGCPKREDPNAAC
ncbi:MAG: hypothetical protein ABI630_01535 [Betaproteobacteria bacterium]